MLFKFLQSNFLRKSITNQLFLQRLCNIKKIANFSTECEPPDESDCEDNEQKKKNTPPFRHAYHEEVEGAVNSQILAELNASMMYLSVSSYYGRTDISMPGCQLFFKMLYKEEQLHALDFINYQLLRGGVVKLYPITVPEDQNWTDITLSIAISLEMEKRVKEKMEQLYEIAAKHNDQQLMEMISGTYIKDQNFAIWELGRLLTRSKRLLDGGGIGRHLFDREVFDYVSKKHPDEDFKQYI